MLRNMKPSNRFYDALHILCFIHLQQGNKFSSALIAGSVNVTPVTIRQITGQLREAGIVQTQAGSGKATLRKEPKDITLLDIFKAVEETGLLKREFDTCPRCNIATSLKTAADETFSRIENAAFEEMKKISLQDVLDKMALQKTTDNM